MGGSFSESGAQSLFDLAEVNPKANDLAIEECCSIDMVETLISFLMQSTPPCRTYDVGSIWLDLLDLGDMPPRGGGMLKSSSTFLRSVGAP